MTRSLVWFRGKDLRIADHEPLRAAANDDSVIPLFVVDKELEHGAHRAQFMLESAAALAKNLEHLGSALVVVRGDAAKLVPELARRWKVDRVLTQRRTEPFARAESRAVAARLESVFEECSGETLALPETIRTQSGTPFSVYTPFSRAFRERAHDIGDPFPAPRSLPPLPAEARRDGIALPALGELGMALCREILPAGERAARARMKVFFAGKAEAYPETRDRMDTEGTSRLSADLRAGLLSVRTVWHEAHRALARSPKALFSFTGEIIWREFAHALLWDRPLLAARPFRGAFEEFPWDDDRATFDAWCLGETGYPIVDAAARELLSTGFVHNRARMIAASFLAKHLFVDYRKGERHYYEHLTDGDQAQNNAGWQWSAGCGVDAQPYFRVFNPTLQGRKFDPDGLYVRRWLPALSRMPARFIHAPSEAPESVLREAGVVLDRDYPGPIVDHAEARSRFLAVARSLVANE